MRLDDFSDCLGSLIIREIMDESDSDMSGTFSMGSLITTTSGSDLSTDPGIASDILDDKGGDVNGNDADDNGDNADDVHNNDVDDDEGDDQVGVANNDDNNDDDDDDNEGVAENVDNIIGEAGEEDEGAGNENDGGADGDLADGAVGGLGIHVHDGALDDGFGEGDPKREFLDRVKRMPAQLTYSHYADELTRLLSHLNARDNTRLPNFLLGVGPLGLSTDDGCLWHYSFACHRHPEFRQGSSDLRTTHSCECMCFVCHV